MSQEGVDLIKAGFELALRGDFETFEEYMAPDVVMVQPPEVPGSDAHAGSVPSIRLRGTPAG
jgi:ketosteroid isomerase-like protein